MARRRTSITQSPNSNVRVPVGRVPGGLEGRWLDSPRLRMAVAVVGSVACAVILAIVVRMDANTLTQFLGRIMGGEPWVTSADVALIKAVLIFVVLMIGACVAASTLMTLHPDDPPP